MAISVMTAALAVARSPLLRSRWPGVVVALYWSALVIIMVGTREVRYGSDMALYLQQYAVATANPSLWDHTAGVDADPAFAAFQWIVARFSADPRAFTLAVSGLAVGAFWLAARVVLPTASATVVLFAGTLSPFFVYYATNTVRQGLAVSLLLVAVAAFMSDKPIGRRWAMVLLVVAPFMHLSAAVPAIVAAALHFRPLRISRCLLIWCGAAMLYVTDANARILDLLGGASERVSLYAEDETLEAYAGGVNRADFLILSIFLVGLVSLLVRSSRRAEVDTASTERAHYLVSVLILWNAYFLCMGFLAYSDRFASYSWLLAPLCIGYLVMAPDLRRRSSTKLAYALSPLLVTLWLQGVPDVLQRTSTIG